MVTVCAFLASDTCRYSQGIHVNNQMNMENQHYNLEGLARAYLEIIKWSDFIAKIITLHQACANKYIHKFTIFCDRLDARMQHKGRIQVYPCIAASVTPSAMQCNMGPCIILWTGFNSQFLVLTYKKVLTQHILVVIWLVLQLNCCERCLATDSDFWVGRRRSQMTTVVGKW